MAWAASGEVRDDRLGSVTAVRGRALKLGVVREETWFQFPSEALA